MVHRTEIQLNSDCPRRAAQTKALLPLSLGLAGSRTNLQEHPLPGAGGDFLGEEGTGGGLLLDVKTYKGKSSPQMQKERKKRLARRAKGLLAGRGVAQPLSCWQRCTAQPGESPFHLLNTNLCRLRSEYFPASLRQVQCLQIPQPASR